MVILDIIRTSTRYTVETIVFKGKRYLQLAKLFMSSRTDKWEYQTSILLDYEATQQFIESIQGIEMEDVLTELDKEVR